MSYCRWGSDSHRCDLYIYESEEGWVCHVASHRLAPKGPWLEAPSLGKMLCERVDADKNETMRAFMRQQQAFSRWLDAVPKEPIDHPLAGETIITDTPGEMAVWLERFHVEGIVFPTGVIDVLHEEQEDMDREADDERE